MVNTAVLETVNRKVLQVQILLTASEILIYAGVVLVATQFFGKE